jgi:glycosyltransferase involved in cell wall biosynthesis
LATGTRDYLVASGVDAARIAVIPNGVAFDSPSSPNRKSSAKDITLIYTGAHGPANGLNVVLEAADLLRDAANVRFVLIGDGPSKQDLIRTTARKGLPNVEFRDPVPKNEIPHLLSLADAGLMILRDAELFAFGVSPNKLGDYMAAGLPIVCNVRGEVAATLAQAGAGIQTTDASPEALAHAVRLLVAMTSYERECLGEAGRAWVHRERSVATLASRLNDYLRGLVTP